MRTRTVYLRPVTTIVVLFPCLPWLLKYAKAEQEPNCLTQRSSQQLLLSVNGMPRLATASTRKPLPPQGRQNLPSMPSTFRMATHSTSASTASCKPARPGNSPSDHHSGEEHHRM